MLRGRRCHSRGGGVQCCPPRVCTADAAGGVIRDCLAAARLCRYAVCYRRLGAGRIIRDHLAPARHCRYAVAFADRNCRYAICYRRLAADHHCRYALSVVVFRSIATIEDTAATGRRRNFYAAHPLRN